MEAAVLGSEAVASGVITRGQLRWNYRAIYPDVYIPRDITPTMRTKAYAAWLWSRRRGVVTGRAAAALHGALWVDAETPVEMVCANNHTPAGVVSYRDRIADDELCELNGITIANPARTALDLGRRCPATRRSHILTRSPTRAASRSRTRLRWRSVMRARKESDCAGKQWI